METQKTSQLLVGESRLSMIDVGAKTPTRRRALASGKIRVGEDAFERIRTKTLPKGDVLALAEVAGIMAAKKASDFIPLCHPLGLDAVHVGFELLEKEYSVRAWCEAIATAKTGVEMEALAGVNAALLSVYDLTKGVNAALWISDIHLEIKEGGKSGYWTHPERTRTETVTKPGFSGLTFVVVTISDRVSQGQAEDRSGPAICEIINKQGGNVIKRGLVPDEKPEIVALVKELVTGEKPNYVILTGGTGLSPRDVTPEALLMISDREIPGLGELLRKSGAGKTAMSWISRSIAVQVGGSVVIALPGSEKAVREGMEALTQILPHAAHIVKGGAH